MLSNTSILNASIDFLFEIKSFDEKFNRTMVFDILLFSIKFFPLSISLFVIFSLFCSISFFILLTDVLNRWCLVTVPFSVYIHV